MVYYREMTQIKTSKRKRLISKFWKSSRHKAFVALSPGVMTHSPPSTEVWQYAGSTAGEDCLCFGVQSFIGTLFHRHNWFISCFCGWPQSPGQWILCESNHMADLSDMASFHPKQRQSYGLWCRSFSRSLFVSIYKKLTKNLKYNECQYQCLVLRYSQANHTGKKKDDT